MVGAPVQQLLPAGVRCVRLVPGRWLVVDDADAVAGVQQHRQGRAVVPGDVDGVQVGDVVGDGAAGAGAKPRVRVAGVDQFHTLSSLVGHGGLHLPSEGGSRGVLPRRARRAPRGVRGQGAVLGGQGLRVVWAPNIGSMVTEEPHRVQAVAVSRP